MTFSAFETSQEGSQPIELYQFALGGTSFFYTSAEDTMTVAGNDYTAIAISRGRLTQSPENRGNNIQVTVPGDNEFAVKYINVVPADRARVTIRRVQRPDFPGPEVVTLFEGFVQSVAFTDDAKVAEINIVPIISATSRAIPRFSYSGLCNHVLYDDGCKVDDTDSTWRFLGTVSAATGNTVTVVGLNGEADGFYTAGFIEINSTLDSRMILDHTGNVLTLLLPFAEDPIGQGVKVLAGCDHTIDVCDTKFNTPEDATSNVINYGGFAFVPTKDIFRSGLD